MTDVKGLKWPSTSESVWRFGVFASGVTSKEGVVQLPFGGEGVCDL
jgi:hypothetical protein